MQHQPIGASGASWSFNDPNMSNIASHSHANDHQQHQVVHHHYSPTQQDYQQQQHSQLPALTDLLSAVGSVSRLDVSLFNLLSGVVAAVEVTNEKVHDLSGQYQELALEVATISRVIHSNQLSSNARAIGNQNNNDVSASSSRHPTPTTATSNAQKPGGQMPTQIPIAQRRHQQATGQQPVVTSTPPPNRRKHQHPGASASTSIVSNSQQQNSSVVAPQATQITSSSNQQQQYLAAESVTMLHSHAVADLESRLDDLAETISTLRVDVVSQGKEALEETYTHVGQICEKEKQEAEEAMMNMARTVEGQMAVRLAELFAEGEAKLMQTAQEAYDNLKQCGDELATSFAQTGKGFVDSVGSAVSSAVSMVTTACASAVNDAREGALLSAHDTMAENMITESRMLKMFREAERLILPDRHASHLDGGTESNINDDDHNSSINDNFLPVNRHLSSYKAPLAFRCCSAMEQVRALYTVLGIDGADAIRVFRSFYEKPVLLSSSSSQQNENQQTHDPTSIASRGRVESLQLILKSPAFRCLDPLPALGLQVADAPPPTEGAEVIFVDPNGRAAIAGLRAGDVIVRVDNQNLGAGAATKSGLHMALLTAPTRPLPPAVKSIAAFASSQQQSQSQQQNETSSSSPTVSSPAARWAPDLPQQDVVTVRTEFGMLRKSSSSGKQKREGVSLTVYRLRDALTFTTVMNLDPLTM